MSSSNRGSSWISSSFRDPSGFVFVREGVIYRQVNKIYAEDFNFLISSGLYDKLSSAGMLVRHIDTDAEPYEVKNAYKIIKPDKIPFISYPYEWCFSQLKNAALLTLEIQKIALDYGMSLKDASSYNVQFLGFRPVFIDTLSFEKYREGKPWAAYRQFCCHFLAPLAVMSYCHVGLSGLLRAYIDGMPLDVASSILPFRSRLNLPLYSHVHLHAKAEKFYSGKVDKSRGKSVAGKKVNKNLVYALIDSLKSCIQSLKWKPSGTVWVDYYNNTNYSNRAMSSKTEIVKYFLGKIKISLLWDLGANTGYFSRIATEMGIFTVSFDIDPAAVELNYLESVKKREKNILPLVMDLTNPSPALGWDNQERDVLTSRGTADAVLALALIHHLAIGNNLPFIKIAKFFSKICRHLIIEFVPKEDSQIQRMLAVREDIFASYDRENFEDAFGIYFNFEEAKAIEGSGRVIYLMDRKV